LNVGRKTIPLESNSAIARVLIATLVLLIATGAAILFLLQGRVFALCASLAIAVPFAHWLIDPIDPEG
jgi:hypothetical protein